MHSSWAFVLVGFPEAPSLAEVYQPQYVYGQAKVNKDCF